MSDDDLRVVVEDEGDDVDSAGTGHSEHLWLGSITAGPMRCR